MKHPLFKDIRSGVYYLLLFLGVFIAHSFIAIYYFRLPFALALLDAFIFYMVFMVLGIGVAYLISYNKVSRVPTGQLVVTHILTGVFLSSLWVHLGKFIAQNLIAHEWYIKNLNATMPARIVEAMFIYAVLILFFYLLVYINNFKEKIEQEAKLNALIKETELSVLKNQINPHFLFNSLNSISSLTITDPEKAQEMVIELSLFLRYTLQHGRNETVSLETEMENIARYLNIEKVRFGKKLNIDIMCDNSIQQSTQLPNMILQPLFENAIKYGVYETTSQVTIHCSCSLKNNMLHVYIVNNFDADSITPKGEGVGLKNIRDRLQLIYGSPEYLMIGSEGNQFKVHLMIPQNDNHHEQD
ncbi:hypothetical protein EMN47_06500 [Prolixibacteraceae bacterium JC049]|nr:hypothetical protein [Prolixibacteraceae bacterium JC049]